MNNFASLITSIRELNNAPAGFLPLHAPVFASREREYVLDTIDSTFVSSVGGYVTRFEELLRDVTGAGHVTACVNGTVALQVALNLSGVCPGDLVLTQSLSFVATANAIRHAGGEPVFLDVEATTLGMSPEKLRLFLENECDLVSDVCRHKVSGKRIVACVPMHTFGHPCRIESIVAICKEWHIALIEDAAEALGSFARGRHCGTFGIMGIVSFNGNKIVTTGGGGAIMTDDPDLGRRAKHVTTTAKRQHPWEFYHDELAWNYRMPNINAALGCGQLEQLEGFLAMKRGLASRYAALFENTPWKFVHEPEDSLSNNWLCSVLFRNKEERDKFLAESNEAGVMTRPAWEPLHTLPAFRESLHDDLTVTMDIAGKLVNLPSGVRPVQ